MAVVHTATFISGELKGASKPNSINLYDGSVAIAQSLAALVAGDLASVTTPLAGSPENYTEPFGPGTPQVCVFQLFTDARQSLRFEVADIVSNAPIEGALGTLIAAGLQPLFSTNTITSGEGRIVGVSG